MRLKAVASSQNSVLGKLETGWTLGCLTTGSVPQGNGSYLVREVLLLGRLRYLLHQVLQPLLRGMRHITHHVWVQLRDAMFLPWGQAALYHHWSSVLPFTVFLLFTGYGFVQPEGTPGRPAGEGVYTCFPETTTVQPHGKHSPGKTGDQEQGVFPSPGQRHTEHAVVVLAKPTRGGRHPRAVPISNILLCRGAGSRKVSSLQDLVRVPTNSEFVANILALSSDRFTPAMDATSLMSSSSLQETRGSDSNSMRGRTLRNSDPRAPLSNHWKGTNLSCILLTPAWNLQPREAPGHCGRIGSRQQDLGAGRAAAIVHHWPQGRWAAPAMAFPELSPDCSAGTQPHQAHLVDLLCIAGSLTCRRKHGLWEPSFLSSLTHQ